MSLGITDHPGELLASAAVALLDGDVEEWDLQTTVLIPQHSSCLTLEFENSLLRVVLRVHLYVRWTIHESSGNQPQGLGFTLQLSPLRDKYPGKEQGSFWGMLE